MDAKEITNDNLEAFLSERDKPLILDFTASWSLACTMYKEKLADVREILGDKAIYGTVDIDFAPEIAAHFSVITIPTTLVFFNGEIVKQYMGIQEPEVFSEAIKDITKKK